MHGWWHEMREGLGRALAVAVLLTVLGACSPDPAPTDTAAPSQAASSQPASATEGGDPSPVVPPAGGEVVYGWPDTTRNPPGVYSWDYSWLGYRPTGYRCGRDRERSSCGDGSMHNGFASPTHDADVAISIDAARPGVLHYEVVVPDGPTTDDSATAVTVAGRDGFYRRLDDRLEEAGLDEWFTRWEEWTVDIEGTTIAIHLWARPGTSRADLAEAHAIIGSMRTEPRDNDLGFRLVFTLTTNHWDSG